MKKGGRPNKEVGLLQKEIHLSNYILNVTLALPHISNHAESWCGMAFYIFHVYFWSYC